MILVRRTTYFALLATILRSELTAAIYCIQCQKTIFNLFSLLKRIFSSICLEFNKFSFRFCSTPNLSKSQRPLQDELNKYQESVICNVQLRCWNDCNTKTDMHVCAGIDMVTILIRLWYMTHSNRFDLVLKTIVKPAQKI